MGRIGSSSADAAVGPFPARAPRVSVNEGRKCGPAYATVFGLVRPINPILRCLRSNYSVIDPYNRVFGQTLTPDFSCDGCSSSPKSSSSLLPYPTRPVITARSRMQPYGIKQKGKSATSSCIVNLILVRVLFVL